MMVASFFRCASSPPSLTQLLCTLLLLAGLLAGPCAAPAAAQDRGVLRQLDRVSLSVTGGYHLNPWDDYNGALDKVTRRIQKDRFFPQPTGNYDKIRGDASVNTTLVIHATSRWHLLLSVQYGQVDSGFEVFADTSAIPENASGGNRGGPAHHQSMEFSFRSIGIGLSYAFPLTRTLVLHPSITAGLYRAQLDLSFRHTRFNLGPIPSDQDDDLSATLDDQALGGQLGLDLRWKLHSNVSLIAGLMYRRAVFDQMQGRGSLKKTPWMAEDTPTSFDVELVEASNYFGVRPSKEEIRDEVESFIPTLTFLTEPGRDARKPTSVDLSAFGVRAGILVNL